jgi:hypothetical protein
MYLSLFREHGRLETSSGRGIGDFRLRVSSNKWSQANPEGNTTFVYRVRRDRQSSGTLAVLFTTLIHASKGDKVKWVAQENTLVSFKNLYPHVRTIVFTKDPHWIKKTAEISTDIHVIDRFQTDAYGTPFLRDMFLRAVAFKEAAFYCYINADIVLSRPFIQTMLAVKAAIQAGALKHRIFLVGRRFNFDLKKSGYHDRPSFNIDKESTELLLNQWRRNASLFAENALDYFMVTRKSFSWEDMPPYIVGRPAYDNCLTKHALLDPGIDTIDATFTMMALHQTGTDGNKAGLRKKSTGDYHWNRAYCKVGYHAGTTRFLKHHTEFNKDGTELLIKARRNYRPVHDIEKQAMRDPIMHFSGGDAARILAVFGCVVVIGVLCVVLFVMSTDKFTSSDELLVEVENVIHVLGEHKVEAMKKLKAAQERRAKQRYQQAELLREYESRDYTWACDSDGSNQSEVGEDSGLDCEANSYSSSEASIEDQSRR